MAKAYSGIGSRQTPKGILREMTDLAIFLDENGYILRSGGAYGADSAFEEGATRKEIYLAAKGDRGHSSHLFGVCEKALEIGEKYHPNWSNLSRRGKLLMARNSYQVLGERLDDPVDFVICYTPNGEGGGGTGQAIRIAEDFGIPIFDLGKTEITGESIKNFVRWKNLISWTDTKT